MRIVAYVLMAIIAFLLVICYSLLVVASEADERAERMYRAWKEKDDGKTVQSADE